MATKSVTVAIDADRLDAIQALVATGAVASTSAFLNHAAELSLEDIVGWAWRDRDAPAARSRRQIAAATGVPIGLLRSLEHDGLLPAADALTVHDEIVVRALTWADGARGGDREHEAALAAAVRSVLAAGTPAADLLLVLVDGQVTTAADPLEALLAMRGRRGVVTVMPVGAWATSSAGITG